jgi:ribosomal protein S27AE
MNGLPLEEQNKIKEALFKKGIKACPMCSNKSFTLVEGYFNNTIQTNFTNVLIGGTSIPSAVLVCSNCGFMSQHALGVLGLLPKENI